MDKCAKTDEHDVCVRHDVANLPLCQGGAVEVLPAGLVEHVGDVLERVVSGSRADGGRGEQQQASVSRVAGDLRWRQLFGQVPSEAEGVVAELATARSGQQHAAVLVEQAQVHRRLAQLEHGQGLHLAVMLADPFPGQAQRGGRRFHVGRREAVGAGALDAFGLTRSRNHE
jgi:hypothetical protein